MISPHNKKDAGIDPGIEGRGNIPVGRVTRSVLCVISLAHTHSIPAEQAQTTSYTADSFLYPLSMIHVI